MVGFPEVSETFICNEIAGMIERGHSIRIAATHKVPTPHHEIVDNYQLLDKCWFLSEALSYDNAKSPLAILEEVMPAANAKSLVEEIANNWENHLAIEQVLGKESHICQEQLLVLIYSLLMNLICREQADIISCQFGNVGEFIIPLRKWIRTPIVTYFHGRDFSTAHRGKLSLDQLFSEGDYFLVNSEYTRSSIITLGCKPERITLVGVAGVDPSLFTFKPRHRTEPLRLMSVARLVEKKGLEYAIRGVASVIKKTQYKIQYDILGEGSLRHKLEVIIEDLGVGSHIRLLGAKTHQQVAEHMSQVHLLLLTSVTASDGDTEGLGVALLEAQMAGIPVLATQHNGFHDAVVDGQSGFLVPERDSVAIEERLIFLIENSSLWPQMGLCGHEHVMKNYTREVVTGKIEQVFRQLGGQGLESHSDRS